MILSNFSFCCCWHNDCWKSLLYNDCGKMLDKHSKVIQAVFNSGECSMAFNLMILHGLARYQAVHIDLIKQWWCLKATLNWYSGAYKFVLLTNQCIFAACIFFIEKKSNVRCYLLKILLNWFIHAFMYAFISLLLGIDIIYIYLRTF